MKSPGQSELLTRGSCYLELLNIVAVKAVAAFRAEFGRILRIFRLPAALIAAIEGFCGRLLGTTFAAEFSLV